MEIPNNSQHQAMACHNLSEMLAIPKIQQEEQERKPRPQADQSLKCPRCDSTNTKFCYYNNYSLSQPRYFCKGCRRYWTQGGSLRNVPVGGGCRKNKRSSLSSSSNSTTSAAAKKTLADHASLINTPPSNMITCSNSNPVMLPSFIAPQLPASLSYDANDLTLAFAGLQKNQHNFDNHHGILLGHANSSAEPTNIPTYGFLDILKSGFMDQNAGATPSGLNNLYYGFGANNNINVDVGAAGSGMSNEEQGNSCKELDEGETKLFMGLQWQDNNLSLDNPGRDYWSSIGSSNWHGLINSSLI